MRVFAYWNLHRHCWSLKALEGAHKGRVVAHCKAFELTDCEMRVSEAGRQRVIREQRKNVHAGVVGTVQAFTQASKEAVNLLAQVGNVRLNWAQGLDLEDMDAGVPITYNPYRVGHFESADLLREPMHKAPRIIANGRRVVACHPA